jgi:DNA-binding NarL/FixJ family response regulator
MTAPLPPDQVAIRLADEGVPLRAIARATNISSDSIREKLHQAQAAGQLVDLPKEDWPPGFPRDQRALQLSRMMTSNPEAIALAIQRTLMLTPTEVAIFITLLQNAHVPKERIDMPHKTVDVHIHNIRRRLAVHGVEIETLWGYGYQLAAGSRDRIMDIVFHNPEESGHDPV